MQRDVAILVAGLMPWCAACHTLTYQQQGESASQTGGAETTVMATVSTALGSASDGSIGDSGTSTGLGTDVSTSANTSGEWTITTQGDTTMGSPLSTDGTTLVSSSGASGTSEETSSGSDTAASSTGSEPCDQVCLNDQGMEPSDGCHDCKRSRLIFVTSEKFDGAKVGGILMADLRCTELAVAAGHKGVYVAWLSGRLMNWSAADRMASSLLGEHRLIRADGKLISNSWSEFLTYGPLVPIDVTEAGIPLGGGTHYIWTGTALGGVNATEYIDGQGFANLCYEGAGLAWTMGGGVLGHRGDLAFVNSNWTDSGLSACNEMHRLVCIQFGL